MTVSFDICSCIPPKNGVYKKYLSFQTPVYSKRCYAELIEGSLFPDRWCAEVIPGIALHVSSTQIVSD